MVSKSLLVEHPVKDVPVSKPIKILKKLFIYSHSIVEGGFEEMS